MKNKVCKECKRELPIDAYYVHSQMADGHLNKCIDCVKDRVKKHRDSNIDRIRAYDRKRGCRQPRKYFEEYNKKFPLKYKAKNMVSNAIRDKRLFKESCEVCGTEERMHAHHDDYAKPLNVRWLCAAHHRQWHIKNGEALNP